MTTLVNTSATTKPEVTPVASSCGVGLIASLCCGGSIVFASIGLGAFYSSLGLARYVPQVLGLGAALIVGINWFYYRNRVSEFGAQRLMRRTMILSAGIGLAFMLVSFILLTWYNHGVVNYARFVSRPEYANALIPFVKDSDLLPAVVSFVAGLVLISVLPLPRASAAKTESVSTQVKGS